MADKPLHRMIYSSEFVSMANHIGWSLPSKTTIDMNYLDLFNDNIVYLTEKRQQKIYHGDLEYWNTLRTEHADDFYSAKPGKIFRKFLEYQNYPPEKLDKVVEILVAKFLAYTADISSAKISIWPSSKIKHAYYEGNYSKQGGTLNNSCMRQKEKQGNLNFYIQNNIEIIVLETKSGLIKGRAILWPPMKIPSLKNKLIRMMDRVYYCHERDNAIFTKFCTENGFISKHEFSDNIWMKVNLDGILCLPYADTMKCLWYKDGILARCHDSRLASELKLQWPTLHLQLSTTTDYIEQLDPNRITEIFSSRSYTKSACIFIEHYNEYVHKDNVITISDKQYSKLDDKVCQLYNNKWDFKNKCVYSNFVCKHIYKSEVMSVYDIKEELDDRNQPTGNLVFKEVDFLFDNKEEVDKNYKSQLLNVDNIFYVKNTTENKKHLLHNKESNYTLREAKQLYNKNIKASKKQLKWDWYEDATEAQFWDVDKQGKVVYNEVLV